MIFALSRSPRAINLKFTPEICTTEKVMRMPMDITTFHLDKWENDRENLCHLFADFHIKIILTVCYVADCYMIRHLPGLFFDFIVKKYEI